MHPTLNIYGFEEVREDWRSILDLAVYLSETIGKHIKKPEMISRFIGSTSKNEVAVSPTDLFEDLDAAVEETNVKKEYLQEERKKLQDAFEGDRGPDVGEKVKSTLMSVWKKMISRSNTMTRFQDIGTRIYKRLIQQFLPFDFEEEGTSLWSGKGSKIENYLEDKIRESMRKSIQAKIRRQTR